jgi:transcription initiation factor IIE alpha subunit
MTTRTITAECNNCESSYDIQYEEELVSQEYPELCPFCGDPIEELSESEYIEDDDSIDEDDEWAN